MFYQCQRLRLTPTADPSIQCELQGPDVDTPPIPEPCHVQKPRQTTDADKWQACVMT